MLESRETDKRLVVRERMPVAQRLLCGFLALLCALIPYELFVSAGLIDAGVVGVSVATALALGALMIGVVLLFAAFGGLDARVVFDLDAHTCIAQRWTPGAHFGRRQLAFDDIRAVELTFADQADGTRRWRLRLDTGAARTLRIGASYVHTEIAELAQRIATHLHVALVEAGSEGAQGVA